MRFLNITFFIICAFSVLSCDKSASDEFEEANGDITPRYLSSISIVSAQNSNENKNVNFSYDANGKLSSVSDGTDNSLFVYENGSLTNITGQNDNLTIAELYESPYDSYDIGAVESYDSNGNPTRIIYLYEEYNYTTSSYEIFEHTADISYETTHNPFFFTMQAAGIIEVLDGVDFNLGLNPQSAQLVQARALLPVNNPSEVVYRDENGTVLQTVVTDYVYNSDNYPTSASVTATVLETNEVKIYTANIQYTN
ncbi:hypothetical protein [Ulvibacter antarcticus]|uniref:YD repeat-containing protein n=1 Tax=Ulvibacter antarcticus TaxID=442714 RepID=A0A3L9Y6C7_9FLAO|nr:hypothetical protein [Ulvibacter antarcticus]RMA56261.1 hypothetical protein BXY75_3460 [Ulvibacter antarcticus]